MLTKKRMDFKDYIDKLNNLDNQEAKVELKNIYILNSSTFKFFKCVDKTVQDLLSQSEISILVVKEIKLILTQLNELKRNINSLDANLLFDNVIKQKINFIKNQMSLSEVEDVSHDFSKLCNERKNLLIKHESEKKRKEQERLNKKKFELQERERKKKEFEEQLKLKQTEVEKRQQSLTSQFPLQIKFKANLKTSLFNNQGGHLYITPQQLIFKPHWFNFGSTKQRVYNILDIKECVKGEWTWLYIYFNDGSEIRLAVYEKDCIMTEIDARRRILISR